VIAGDLGYSLLFGGQVWWLFGDTHATVAFPLRSATPNASTRWPGDTRSLDNDSVAISAPRSAGGCPQLKFVTEGSSGQVPGAFQSPSVRPDPEDTAANSSVSLRTNETPVAGITVRGVMYATFQTDNPRDLKPDPGCNSAACRGRSTRSVMAQLIDPSQVEFRGLYNLSAPAVRFGQGAKFVSNALEPSAGCDLAAPAPDCYVYIWGVEGGHQFGTSAPYLARIPASNISTGAGIRYFHGLKRDGTPDFETGEASATALFHDRPSDCMSYVAVEYDPFVSSWIMLYNCGSAGVDMRTAPEPWGPWSARQLILDPSPNPLAQTGECYFFVSAGPCPKTAPLKPNRSAKPGHAYAPYFVAGATSGHAATSTLPAVSTFSYAVSTLDPYGQVVLHTTIEGPNPTRAKPPNCTPGPHGTCV
jgi:hypothetical protein